MSPREMSQLDPIDELRAAPRPVAPAELRARVLELAASASTPPPRRLTWRRASFALVPALGVLVVAAVVLGNRGADRTAATNEAAIDVATRATSTVPTDVRARPSSVQSTHGTAAGTPATALKQQQTLGIPPAPAPTPGRVVRYSTYLELRIRTADGVARAAQRALRTARSLGGYPASTTIDTQGRTGSAELVLRIPRAHVQQAIARLSALGSIVGEHVQLQDLQGGLKATETTIARVQKRLRDLRALPQTDTTRRQIAATTARIASLQRASRSTRRAAHFATVQLQLHTPRDAHPEPRHHGHGPLHGLGVAFRWIGIGAVYALALGGPLVLLAVVAWLVVRTVRRRREEALLNSA